VQVRRCLIAANGPVRFAELFRWCYARADRPKHWQRTAIHRAAVRVAVVLERNGKRGNLWALKPDQLVSHQML
jgi:hypothetical protein